MTDQSEWWCALCPTSHPTRDALDKHTVATHPAPVGSTSAQLRQTQTALAASQADLTCVERERDLWMTEGANAARRLTAEREMALQRWAECRDERDLARAELASANAELDRWRKTGQDAIAQSGWIVARDGGRRCVACRREITRGQAYEPLAAVDELKHIHCPTTEGAPA